MNQTVKRIVDLLFEDTVENEETRALHEELMNNCQERYHDLISRGLSEEEATGEVVDSLKGMKDVIAEYPKKSSTVPPKAQYHGKKQNSRMVPTMKTMGKSTNSTPKLTVLPKALSFSFPLIIKVVSHIGRVTAAEATK